MDSDAAELLAAPPQQVRSWVAEEVSSALEETLTNTDLPKPQRLWQATLLELSYLVPLAGPAIVVYLLNNVTSMSTQIFCGHLGNLELAAASLGNNGVQLLAYGLMVCIYVLASLFLLNQCLLFISLHRLNC
uniref:Protein DETOXIFICATION n=1 Tax=Opuntia streptacantha TaxID=393608 RepID=A0A7C9DYR0_OPUST